MIKKSLLCLLAILINNVNSVEPPDLTLVFNQNSTKHFCIAEGNVLDSGIGWIFPITEKLPQIVTNYEPKTENEYNCDFSEKECINLWQMDDWQYSSYNSHDLKPTLDSRWDNFPTILTLNNTKDFDGKTKIPNIFHVGLSIRAEKNAEIFLCEGWDPHTHACYYINIGGAVDNKQAFLRKYKSIPEKMNRNDTKLSKYKSDIPILSEKVWKNFAISLSDNGTLNVFDVDGKSIILNYTDSKQLKPIYLLLRSTHNKALWKIHNNQYILTNKTAAVQMGPTFSIYGHNLCVSLYTSMCKSCKMSFYMLINEEKKVLKEVSNKHDESNLSWKKIKLVYRNILENKIKIFVETKYFNSTIRNGFWAIDDVRVCNDNEIKVSQLMTNSSDEMAISCQALDFPAWRPTQHTISSTAAEEVKTMLAKPTSIRLIWKKSSKVEDNAERFYIAHYKGADTCNISDGTGSLIINKNRRKSQGYVISKNNDIVIKDLVPYTLYNITLFNILEGNQQTIKLNTLPTEIPTKEELPKNVKMQVTTTTNQIQWDSVACNVTYGPIYNKLLLKLLNDNNNKTFWGVQNSYNLTNLTGFSNYSLEIVTARKLENLINSTLTIKSIYNFTTSPDVAPRVKNFELYATSKNSASFRYVLPKFQRGIPALVQIQWCNPLLMESCNSDIQNITKCSLWRDKYCLEVKNLSRGFDYKFKLSVKNKGTHAFGQESHLRGSALERAPGKPENITYEMVKCQKLQNFCNINITWSHPYNQTGTITMFDVTLSEGSFSFTTDAKKDINEIVKIKQYRPTYSYVVKYLPKNVQYKISVRSVNDAYKSNISSIYTKTEDGVNDHIDETPTYINSTNETITFKLPELDWRFNSSTLIIFAQDYAKTEFVINEDIRKLKLFENDNKLCNQSGNVWIAHSIKINKTSSPIIVIGDNSLSRISQLNKTVINMALKPDTEYCFTFALVQQNGEEEDLMIYHEQHLFTQSNHMLPDYQSTPEQIISPAAYLIPILLIILLVAFGAWFGYRHLKKRNLCRGNDEHVYESMPFDDYIAGSFSNNTYDKLLHD